MAAQPKSISPDEPWDALSDDERIAVELRAAGWKQKDIADHFGVHRTTVYRWFKKPEADAYGAHLRAERMNETKMLMAEATNSSVRAVLKATDNGDAKVGLGWLSLGPIYWKGRIGTV